MEQQQGGGVEYGVLLGMLGEKFPFDSWCGRRVVVMREEFSSFVSRCCRCSFYIVIVVG